MYLFLFYKVVEGYIREFVREYNIFQKDKITQLCLLDWCVHTRKASNSIKLTTIIPLLSITNGANIAVKQQEF